MFGQKKLLQKQLDDYAVQVNTLEREVSRLKEENRICLEEKDRLLQQVTKYKVICREIAPPKSSAFSASTNHKDAIVQMNTHFPCDFCCLVATINRSSGLMGKAPCIFAPSLQL